MKYDVPPILNYKEQHSKLRVSVAIIVLGITLTLILFVSGSRSRTDSPLPFKIGSAPKPTTLSEEAIRPTPIQTPTPPSQILPSSIINLSNWKLTLPRDEDHDDKSDEIFQPSLATYLHPQFFMPTADGQGVIFRAPVNGSTTKNSDYPRSELREMSPGGDNASWSNRHGIHTLEITQAITHLPRDKSEVVAGQIHDNEDDVIMIRLENKRLFVEADGKDIGLLTGNYVLGTTFAAKIVASQSRIEVYYNGERKVTYNKSGSGWYFKAGCYTQSNAAIELDQESYGEVIIYNLDLTHE